jgi:hypothetical protein
MAFANVSGGSIKGGQLGRDEVAALNCASEDRSR